MVPRRGLLPTHYQNRQVKISTKAACFRAASKDQNVCQSRRQHRHPWKIGYNAQRDPKIEYQREGFELFGEMEQRIDDSFAEYVFKFGYPRPNLQPKATARRVDGGSPAAARAASSPAPR